MRKMMMVVMATMLGCLEIPAAPPGALQPAETCPAPPDGSVDFLGEPCTEDVFPAVTTCHDGAGWCVAGTCRPMCNSTGCRHCDDGAYTLTERGACYCSPD